MERSNPTMRKNIVSRITASSKWWEPWKWSARKAQLAVLEYKSKWGKYSWPKKADNKLTKRTKEERWTKSWKPSSKTGERYLPKKAIKALTPKQYKATSDAKRKWWGTGKVVKQPKKIANITKKYR